MNKAQNRPTLHKVLSMILALVMVLSLLPLSGFTASSNDEVEGYDYNIMFLDCGRKYFSVDSIKTFIYEASAAGFNYIQLAVGNDGMRFLLDDMSLTVKGTTYSSDDVKSAIQTGNAAYNETCDDKATEDDKQYYSYAPTVNELTQSEMDTIIAYAHEKGMGVIPCINTPGHMDAILDAAEALTGVTCAYSGSNTTIDITNSTAVEFTKAFLQKYITYFASKGCTLFNMGADEYANDSGSPRFSELINSGNYDEYIAYINAVASMIKAADMTPMAFNDGIYYNNTTNCGSIDTDIIVCYWSKGWSGYDVASASFLSSYFKMVNTHGDYYYVLGKTAQCSADKASGFNYKTFMGSTVDNPAGSMFCIWCDYPGSKTEDEVITGTEDTIKAFGGVLPAVEAGKVTVKDSSAAVKVTAPGLTSLTASETEAPVIESAADGKILAYDVTPATADGSYKGSASVSMQIPTGWVSSKVCGFVVNDNGSVETITTGTASNGFYTFTVPHFSTVGIYESSSSDETNKTVDVTVTVNGTKTITVDGSYIDSYVPVNEKIATVSTELTTASKELKAVTKIESGKQYLLVHVRSDTALTNTANGNFLLLTGEKSAENTKDLWTITSSSGSDKFTVMSANDKYLKVSKGGASTTSDTTKCTLTYDETNACWDIANSGGTQHLNQYGGKGSTNAGGWEQGSDQDVGSRWYICEIVGGSAATKITFNGRAIGNTTVTIGDVTYNITVVSEDLENVDPITIEYWITNGRATGNTSNKQSIEISATDNGIATSNGVYTSDLVDKTATRDRTLEYWQTKILTIDKENTSTSSTELQTTISGDDETLNGEAFTKIRYWGGAWQVYTTEWINVDCTETTVDYTYKNVSYTYKGVKNQLVAYYMEVVDIKNANGTTNLHVNAADWGTKGDGSSSIGYYVAANDLCSISLQLVYADNTRNPADTNAATLMSKTFVYGYWTDGRGIGTMIFNGAGNYQIYKVTAETGTMSCTVDSDNTVTVNSFAWADNEEAVWKGEAQDSVSIGNSARVPSYESPYDNLAWNTGAYNKNNAILIRVYVKAIPNEDSLTVNYIEYNKDKNNTPFYNYSINVAENTKFSENFRRVEDSAAVGGAKLENNTVTNYEGSTQTVQSDLSKMTEISAQYRYSDYEFVAADRSTDGKTVNLYYTFNSTKTFVVDFGLPVVIQPKDMNANLGGTGVSITSVDITSKTSHADIKVDGNQNIVYTLKEALSEPDNFGAKYSGSIPTKDTSGKETIQKGDVTYSVTIIPASTVYYEDSFATFNEGKYTADSVENVVAWTTEGTTQENVTQALEALDSKQNVYGYDDAYKTSTQYSLGSANKVTVSADMAKDTDVVWPSATFTFKGTGFDIISLTDNTSGAIFVDVYKGDKAEGDRVKSYFVNNYYGYSKDANGKWVVNEDSTDKLYQIPVMKITGLDYATYTVVISAEYDSFFDKTGDNQYSFWLDAIRVYDPMGKDNNTYVQDEEGYPQYIKLRDELADKEASIAGNSKVVFIDGGNTADIETYANYGPNNEVYLASGQAISFKIPDDLANLATVQIGAKSPNGTAKMSVTVNSSTSPLINGKEIGTATEMYYKLDNVEAGDVITISNTNTTGNIILSLTNVKLTFTEAPTASTENTVSLAAMDTEEQEVAVMAVRALFAAPTPVVETFEPDTFKVSLSRNSISVGQKATLTVKASAEVTSITVNGETYDSYKIRYERSGWGWWSAKTEYHIFTVSLTPTETTEYNVVAVNADGAVSETETVTLTVKAAQSNWWDNVWNNFFGKWF